MTIEEEREFLAEWGMQALQGGVLTVPTHPCFWWCVISHAQGFCDPRKCCPDTALPPYSPELNPTEQIWNILLRNYFANRVFDSLDAAIAQANSAWQKWRLTRELSAV